MANEKKVYSSTDGQPVVLYAKTDAADDKAYPVLATSTGVLISGSGIGIPAYDFVSMVISPSDTETYTFKTGGSDGSTVATVIIVYTDSTRIDISTVTKT
jgi:hypothetical protein